MVLYRPSGTEPKVKMHFGVKGKDQNDAEERLFNLEKAFLSTVKEVF